MVMGKFIVVWRKPGENPEKTPRNPKKTPRKPIFSEIKALVPPRAGSSSNIHMDGESKVKAADANEMVGFLSGNGSRDPGDTQKVVMSKPIHVLWFGEEASLLAFLAAKEEIEDSNSSQSLELEENLALHSTQVSSNWRCQIHFGRNLQNRKA